MLFGLRVALESEADYERRYIVLPRVSLLFRFYGPHYETFGIPSGLYFFFLVPILLYSRIPARIVRDIRHDVCKGNAKCLFVYSSPLFTNGFRARLRERRRARLSFHVMR